MCPPNDTLAWQRIGFCYTAYVAYWPKAEGQLSVYYAAKRTLTVICLSAVDNTQAPSLRDHLDESRNTMPAGPLR